MRYVTLTIQVAADGTVATAAHSHDDLAHARSAYHSELAAGALSEALASDACMVLTPTGDIVDRGCVPGLAATHDDAGGGE